MAKTDFPGFSKDFFKFINDLKKNNNREWYHENKDRYKHDVVIPMCNFIKAMGPRLETICEDFVADSRPHGGSMFRIYRDTRFAKDKTPYKEHIACHFRHSAGKDAHAPGFYLHIEPKKVMFGGGVWCPPNPILHKIRSRIIEKPDDWKKVISNKSFNKRFGAINGEQLKRPPRGFDKEQPHMDDLRRKSFFVIQSVTKASAMDSKFITEVERAYKSASPMMEFITRALELPYDQP